MNRLPVFDLADKTVSLLAEKRELLEKYAKDLEEFFTACLSDCSERLVAVSTRVKAEGSLREKIFRKNLYQQFTTPETLLHNLHDLIGIRIQCRFLAEEDILWKEIKERYTQKCEDGRFCAEGNPNIRLEMTSQPQTETNGFSIYRIDGMIGEGMDAMPFELQIKALVHVFWAEVEHEIIYKNNSYMFMDSFMREMLSSAYDNLRLVDRQLYLIYNQIHAQDGDRNRNLREDTLRALLAKSISDLFYKKMQESLGFTLNFKLSCDILSRYILNNIHEKGKNNVDLMSVFAHLNSVYQQEIDFTAPLNLEEPYSSREPFLCILSEYFTEKMNSDYEWNLFFRMLFALEPGNNLEDYSNLLQMIYERFTDDALYAPLLEIWTPYQVENYKRYLLIPLAHQLVGDGRISIIYEDTFQSVTENIEKEVLKAADALKTAQELPIPEALFTGNQQMLDKYGTMH